MGVTMQHLRVETPKGEDENSPYEHFLKLGRPLKVIKLHGFQVKTELNNFK